MKHILKSDIQKQISEIHFSILEPAKLKAFSSAEILKKEIYDINTKLPVLQGPLDPHLGTVKGTDLCQVCNQSITCPGHFGNVDLHFPVFHVGFFKQTYNILQCICKTCGSILQQKDKQYQKKTMKLLIEESRRVIKCIECNSDNYPMKRGPGFKLYHGESKLELSPLFVYNLFKLIKKCDYSMLNLSVDPIFLLIKSLPVPPSNIRPSVKMLTSSNEDDLTVKLCEIIHTNDVLKSGIEKGNPLSVIQEDWDFLQLQVSLFINSDLPNFNKADSNLSTTRQIRGVIQRLKGKGGRFRGNLSGKRVDFSGRTVISPDPNLSIEEVGIPVEIAKILTISDSVTSFNKKDLIMAIKNGPNIHPGANYYESGGRKSFLQYANRDKIITNMKEGDIVERHVRNGDILLFNRQPSLHRISIMAHKAKIHTNKTLRFNECVCTPYNADFDGDEMNVHVPQTIESRVEAFELMRVGKNLVTPRNGEPLVACTQDFITAMYVLTGKNIFFTKEKFGQILGSFLPSFEAVKTLACIKRPLKMYSGKQVFDLLIKYSLNSGNLMKAEKNAMKPNKKLTLELRSKNRSHKDSFDYFDDTMVIFKDGHYLCGRIDKAIIGSENKNGSLIYKLLTINSACAITAMNLIAKLSSFFLSNYGFSIGLDDVKPTAQLLKNKEKLVEKIYDECHTKIEEFNMGVLKPLPGCTALETLESSLSSLLSKIRDECGNFCIKELGPLNTPIIMQACGSKGSKINVAQMVACVGQQIISGKRISDSFTCNINFATGKQNVRFSENDIDCGDNSTSIEPQDKMFSTGLCTKPGIEKISKDYQKNISSTRTLPHYDPSNSLSPLAKGFVCNSFYSGLSPSEFFFHAVSGREGLVDTAVKTAETGYMQRRLMKAMEDLKIAYDNTVRNAVEDIIQFTCVEDKNDVLKTSEPGTAVGAIAGQSIGEPGTQMTLKTFHFAGVASMNITLGVPRLKEIINATKNIMTPIINAEIKQKCELDDIRSVSKKSKGLSLIEHAYTIKGRIEKTFLKDICSSLTEVYGVKETYLELLVDLNAIIEHRLEITMEDIKSAISKENKIPFENVVVTKNVIEVYIKKNYYDFKTTKRKILDTIVYGIKSVNRCVVNEEKNGKYALIIEGTGLKEVLGIEGIKSASSNNVLEIMEVLGIEAAREAIIKEVLFTMEGHGITIDKKHVELLADTMTAKGTILGITRFGISKMKMSTLMLASFEQTSDHLFDAALKGKKDPVKGVSESIIVGKRIDIGTGVVDLYFNKNEIENQK